MATSKKKVSSKVSVKTAVKKPVKKIVKSLPKNGVKNKVEKVVLIENIEKTEKTEKVEKKVYLVKRIIKRSGEIVSFDFERIVSAIHKAMISVGEGSEEEASLVANKVYADLVRVSKKYKNFIPDVEGIQDT